MLPSDCAPSNIAQQCSVRIHHEPLRLHFGLTIHHTHKSDDHHQSKTLSDSDAVWAMDGAKNKTDDNSRCFIAKFIEETFEFESSFT